MIVIGLDGATWSVIKPNIGELPGFRSLLEKYRHSVLECDVRPVHSAPSWSTIFSGITPETSRITDFVMDETKRKELAERKMFIWDRVGRAIVMGVPVSLPPINVNYSIRQWEPVILSVTEEEMLSSTKKLLGDTIGAIEYGEADLVAVVFSETDRAGHLFWHEPEAMLRHYKSVDAALQKLEPYLEGRDFLILSDHGFTDAEETRKNGWDNVRAGQSGGHHPEGIAISNGTPPAKVSQVCSFISASLERRGLLKS